VRQAPILAVCDISAKTNGKDSDYLLVSFVFYEIIWWYWDFYVSLSLNINQ